MDNEVSTGSLDTNVRLLGQRIATAEIQLNRIGDSVRGNHVDSVRVEERIKRLAERITGLEAIDKKIDDRFFQVQVGVGFALLGVLIQFLIDLKGMKG